MAASKRKRLSFEEKFEIVKKSKSNISKERIIEEYGISERTYFRIIRSDLESLTDTNTHLFEKRKSARTSDNVHLDNALIIWFAQERGKGNHISGPQLKKKALILNEKLNGPTTFKASAGWLSKFRTRYGIRVKDEKSTTENVAADEDFPQFLTEKIRTENLLLDNVYNADESVIYWKSLVSHTLDSPEEENIGQEENKECVTVLFCSNASGSHRIPLLIIDKCENSSLNNFTSRDGKKGRLKTIENLDVTYSYRASGFMDRFIFMEWYKEEFIPRVLEHQRTSGKLGKAILILDNAPFHPTLVELNAVNTLFEVLYLPPIVTGLIQPMEQGVTSTTIQLYKKHLLRRLLLNDTQEGAVKFLKQLDLRDCLLLMKSAWESLNSFSLQKAWKPILGDLFPSISDRSQNSPVRDVDDNEESLNDESLLDFPHDLCNKTIQLLSGPKCSDQSKQRLSKWFHNEDYDCGWVPLSNDAVENFFSNGICEPIVNISDKTAVIPGNNFEMASLKALEGLENFKDWLKTYKKCLPVHLFYIQELETLAKNSLSCLEKKI